MTSGKLFGLFLLLAVALIVMACTTPEESSCDTAWAKAAAISDLRDTVEDLDPAIRACTSLQEWESAAAKYPDALDGVDPVLFLSNRCYYGSRLVSLCQWLIAHPESIEQNSALAIATRFADVSSHPTTAPAPISCLPVSENWQNWMFDSKSVDAISAVPLVGKVLVRRNTQWEPAENPATGFVWFHFMVAARVGGATSTGLWLVHHVNDDSNYSSFPVNEAARAASDVGSSGKDELRYSPADEEAALSCAGNS
jgi:hypothetical protein